MAMADVSYLKFSHLQQQSNSLPNFSMDNNLNSFYLNPPPPPLPSSHNSHFEPDYLDSVTGPNCFYGDDQMNFVTDLFESCEEYVHEDPDAVSDPFLGTAIRVSEGSAGEEDFCSNHVEELGLGFVDEFDMVSFDSLTTQHSNSNARGLRVVGIDSDSDTEDIDANDNSDLPSFGNGLLIDNQRAGREESNSEEVDERERLSSVIDRIEEISFSSGTCSEDEDDIVEESERNLEWEVLLAVNNLDRNIELGNVGDDISYLTMEDDYTYDAEYDSLVGQIVESASSLKISPPAAKSVVENLPCVVLTKEDLQDNNVVCAVCKDEIFVEEEVTRLPCCHHYHGDCIVPWLRTRNTCPVCRFELPTDNVNYEKMKIGEGHLQLSDDLQVRDHFELSS